MTEGFKRSSRVNKPEDFDRLKKNGIRKRSGLLTASFLPGAVRRIGIVVTKKTGNAVLRNKVKRNIREYFRINKELFPKGEIIIVAAPRAGELEPKKIREMLHSLVLKYRS